MAAGEVGKLSYTARGPFIIVEVLGGDSYHVQRYNDKSSAIRKYKGTDLYFLPPAIFPSDPLDTMDVRYLNYSNAPIVHPLKKALKIEVYNDMFFDKPPVLQSESTDKFSCQLDEKAMELHDNFKSVTAIDIFKECKTDTSNIPPTETLTQDRHKCTHDEIIASKHKLFFIRYTPEHTLRQRWYLVQVDMDASLEMNKDKASMESYRCVFLARHPHDVKKSDEFSRFWPEWHKYTRCPKTDQILFGDSYLIRPNHTPNKDKFIQWSDDILLCSAESQSILGPFEFEKVDAFNRTRRKVSMQHWKFLYDECIKYGMVPPTFGNNSTQLPPVHYALCKKRKLGCIDEIESLQREERKDSWV